MADGGLGLAADGLVGLAEMLAALGVAELDEVEAAVPELERRDLAGPGAGVGPVHVLGADLDAGGGERALDLADGGEGGDDEGLDAGVEAGDEGGQRLGEGEGLGEGLVHLPAGADPGRHARPLAKGGGRRARRPLGRRGVSRRPCPSA